MAFTIGCHYAQPAWKNCLTKRNLLGCISTHIHTWTYHEWTAAILYWNFHWSDRLLLNAKQHTPKTIALRMGVLRNYDVGPFSTSSKMRTALLLSLYSLEYSGISGVLQADHMDIIETHQFRYNALIPPFQNPSFHTDQTKHTASCLVCIRTLARRKGNTRIVAIVRAIMATIKASAEERPLFFLWRNLLRLFVCICTVRLVCSELLLINPLVCS
jgi:hypothetical protein